MLIAHRLKICGQFLFNSFGINCSNLYNINELRIKYEVEHLNNKQYGKNYIYIQRQALQSS